VREQRRRAWRTTVTRAAAAQRTRVQRTLVTHLLASSHVTRVRVRRVCVACACASRVRVRRVCVRVRRVCVCVACACGALLLLLLLLRRRRRARACAHPAASSKAEILRCASLGMMSASLSHGLVVVHCPLEGALVPVPHGPGIGPSGAPRMPLTYGRGHGTLAHATLG
jgi:hypothetical protein